MRSKKLPARQKQKCCGAMSGRYATARAGTCIILDPRVVMFAQGNRDEKMRMARCIRESPAGSRVADMFAGIGYFTIPMAGSGAQVHAMEINPVAFGYLEKNIQENNLVRTGTTQRSETAVISARRGLRPCRDGALRCDPHAPAGLPHVHEGSVIHLHSLGTVEEAIREIVEGAGFSPTIEVHKVKKYRPHVWHIVQDVTLS